MRTRYLGWIISLLLISCISTVDRPDLTLLHADSLIHSGHPDSALFLLDSLNLSHFSTEVSKAWYALLLTQAKDKNYIPHTDDSLIRRAVDYFDASNDILQRAKAHYYWGRVYQDKGEVENTVREYLTSLALLKKADDYELNILLKSNLGFLFWENGLYTEADSLYKEAVELAEVQRDTLRLATALIKRADICIEKGPSYYADADKIMNWVMKLMEGIENAPIKSNVFSSLSYLRDYQGKWEEAISYANQGLQYTSDNSAKKGYYLILGCAYTQLEDYDSAVVYLKRSLHTNDYYTKASAYMKLSEVASVLGDKDKALKYETLYGTYKDSINLQEQPVKVVSSLKDVLYSQSVNHYELFLNHYRFYLLLTGGLLCLFVCFYLYRRKKRKMEMVELKMKHQSLFMSIERLKEDLLRKENEINDLRKHCEQLEGDSSQKVQLENCLKELVEQYHLMQKDLEKQLEERNKELIKWRSSNLKSALASCDIYAKLLEVCQYNSQNPDAVRKLSSEEWSTLVRELDIISLGFVERLQNHYEYLLEDDIHFCCLVKLEFKYSDIASIWGCSTVAIHKRSQSVLHRMGFTDTKKAKLIEVLNEI